MATVALPRFGGLGVKRIKCQTVSNCSIRFGLMLNLIPNQFFRLAKTKIFFSLPYFNTQANLLAIYFQSATMDFQLNRVYFYHSDSRASMVALKASGLRVTK